MDSLNNYIKSLIITFFQYGINTAAISLVWNNWLVNNFEPISNLGINYLTIFGFVLFIHLLLVTIKLYRSVLGRMPK